MALQTRQKSNLGPNGLAEIRLLKEKVKVIFAEDGDIYELPLESWTDNEFYGDKPAGNYIVGLNKERTDFYFVKPPGDSTWYVRFKEFVRKGSDTPTPYIQKGGKTITTKDGGSFVTQDEMRAAYYLEILDPDGKYDGMSLWGNIPYIFEQATGTTHCELVGKKRQLELTERFLRVTGFDFVNDSIQYSPNVLPQLERMLQEKGAIFSVKTNEKGFVQEMSEVPVNFLPEELRK